MNNPDKQSENGQSQDRPSHKPAAEKLPTESKKDTQKSAEAEKPKTEHGGAKGPEPTRYGDWEHNGRCTDF